MISRSEAREESICPDDLLRQSWTLNKCNIYDCQSRPLDFVWATLQGCLKRNKLPTNIRECVTFRTFKAQFTDWK